MGVRAVIFIRIVLGGNLFFVKKRDSFGGLTAITAGFSDS